MAAKNFSSELLFSVDWVLHRLCIVVSLYWDYIIRVQWPAIIIEHPNDYIYNYNLGKLLFSQFILFTTTYKDLLNPTKKTVAPDSHNTENQTYNCIW